MKAFGTAPKRGSEAEAAPVQRPRPIRIAVIGSGEADAESCDVARRVGKALARAGAILVCGGLGGVMAAAAEGASEEGGTVIGILPGEDAGSAASGVTVPLPTGLGDARNVLVVRAAEAAVAVAGGWGTLSEAAFCLKLGVPLVGVRDHLPPDLPFERTEDPETGVARALALARQARGTSAG